MTEQEQIENKKQIKAFLVPIAALFCSARALGAEASVRGAEELVEALDRAGHLDALAREGVLP